MKRILVLLAASALAVGVAGCGGDGNTPSAPTSSSATESTTVSCVNGVVDTEADASTTPTATEPLVVTYYPEDLDASWNSTTATNITLAGNSAKVLGNGATATGDGVTITAGGTYVISGTLDDGQILVDSEDKETVRLVLNDMDLTCSNGSQRRGPHPRLRLYRRGLDRHHIGQ